MRKDRIQRRPVGQQLEAMAANTKPSHVDLGLSVLARVRYENPELSTAILTQRDLAEICECTFQAIGNAERRILRKLRQRAEESPEITATLTERS